MNNLIDFFLFVREREWGGGEGFHEGGGEEDV